MRAGKRAAPSTQTSTWAATAAGQAYDVVYTGPQANYRVDGLQPGAEYEFALALVEKQTARRGRPTNGVAKTHLTPTGGAVARLSCGYVARTASRR